MLMRLAQMLSAALVVSAAAAPAAQTAPPPKKLVEQFVEAFNRHDVPGMRNLVDPDVQWMTISGSTISVETNGAEALDRSMRSYFRSCPSCRSVLDGIMEAGNLVTTYERAQWTSGGVPRTQTSLAVYEVRNGRIRRVWYYRTEGDRQ